jgi:hypothetical protein
LADHWNQELALELATNLTGAKSASQWNGTVGKGRPGRRP